MNKSKEKIVFIRRAPSKSMSKNEALRMIDNNAMKYLGAAAYGNTGLPVTGLTDAEKFAIMPVLVQLSNTHNEFDLAVNKYFHELRELVPAGKGLRLNITTNPRKINFNGVEETIDYPENPYQYVLYKRAISPYYRQCADNMEALKSGGNRVKFYIHDVEVARKVEIELGDTRDKAASTYLDIVENTKVWEPILLVYGFNPDNMSKNEQKSKLRELSSASNVVDATEQLEAFNKFIEVAGDKDLETKALIQKLVTAKVILSVGTSYIYDNGATSVTIGSDEVEAVAWMKDSKNSKDVLTMKAKLKSITD